jgi:hypothetical protein
LFILNLSKVAFSTGLGARSKHAQSERAAIRPANDYTIVFWLICVLQHAESTPTQFQIAKMQPHTALYILALLACSSAAAADRALLQTTRMDDLSSVTLPQANAAASALRIATVQATPSGPVFTLAGQLDSASQLLQAMTASQVQ